MNNVKTEKQLIKRLLY